MAGQAWAHPTPAGTRRVERSRPSWYESKRPVLRFVSLFAIFLGMLYLCQIIPFYRSEVSPWLLRLNAEGVGTLLSTWTHGITVRDASIASPRYAMEIKKGCDAVQPLILFVAAVLASPVGLRAKISGVLGGTILIMAMNLVRLVTLFYAGIYSPSASETLHLEVWPLVFILFAVFLWLTWVRLAQRKRPVTPHATA